MPLLIIPFLLGLIAVGIAQLYASVAARYGASSAIMTIVTITAIVIGLVYYLIHRHYYFHGKTTQGKRVLELSGEWGLLTIDAVKKRGQIILYDQQQDFIFSDLRNAECKNKNNLMLLVLSLNNAPLPHWEIPVIDRKQARRWQKILKLAAQQEL